MNILKDFFKILITSNNKNLDIISKKIEITSKKTTELKSLQEGIYTLQKQLIENQNKLSSIINTATDAIVVLDLEGNVILWNKAAEYMFQYTIEEIHTLGIGVVLDSLDKIALEKYMQELKLQFITNKNINIKNKVIYKKTKRKDGSIFSAELSISSWRNNGDLYFTCIIRDLTEREDILKRLYTVEAIHSLVISNVADGIMVFDKQLNYITWNPAMENITGYKEDQVLGKNVFDIFPGLKDSEIPDIFKKVLNGEEASTSLFLYTDKNGIKKYLKGKYTPLYNIDKTEIIGIICVIRIVTKDEIKSLKLVQNIDSTGKITK